ncbi:MAG: hypothetical protein H6832_16585 [Planctomycetes bacterium]|nr:hypothetical protein [Planctomycetota bacterium]MCB9920021.1 hypothetical protein [Planctomycetota bacterium]
MNLKIRSAALFLAFAGLAVAQTPVVTPIRYQGRLTQAGLPRNGTMNFALAVFDSASGLMRGREVFLNDVPVVDGLFTLEADFGESPWAEGNAPRELRIRVALPNSTNYVTLSPRQKIVPTPVSHATRGLNVTTDATGRHSLVGIGTGAKAALHVKGPGGYRGHVAVFENDLSESPNSSANGVAIKLHKKTNKDDNFVTFYDGSDTVTGRIEGFDLDNGDWQPPPFDIKSLGPVMEFKVDFGEIPTPYLDGGRAPSASLSGGSLPSATFGRGSLPTASFSPGSLPSLSFTKNKIGVINGINFDKGSLPSLSFNPGSLPSLSFQSGSFPTLGFDAGALPKLDFLPGRAPTFDVQFNLPNTAQIEALAAWATMHDVDSLIQLDPVSLITNAIKVSAKGKALSGGVVYGSKGADYAEWLPKLDPKDTFQLGQIIGVFGGKISLRTKGADQVMAISRMPIVLGNLPADGETDAYEKAAFLGQVPVLVRGRCKAGDYVVPSGLEDGTAIAVAPQDLRIEHLEHLLGRAWSDSDNEIYTLINVVVGQRGSEVATILRNQETKIGELAKDHERLGNELVRSAERQQDLESRLEALEAALAAVTARSPR